jgi:hypothetical protein
MAVAQIKQILLADHDFFHALATFAASLPVAPLVLAYPLFLRSWPRAK